MNVLYRDRIFHRPRCVRMFLAPQVCLHVFWLGVTLLGLVSSPSRVLCCFWSDWGVDTTYACVADS